jgi:hypothetical protein
MMGVALLFLVLVQDPIQLRGFTGTWTLDPAKSVLWPGGARQITLVLLEDRQGITVTERRPSGDERYVCAFDGKPREHKTASGGLFTRTVRRDRNRLTFRIIMTRLADQASLTYREEWSLSADGQTLTVHEMYPGEREVLKVFSRER